MFGSPQYTRRLHDEHQAPKCRQTSSLKLGRLVFSDGHNVIFGHLGLCNNEIDRSDLEGLEGLQVHNIKPPEDRFVFPDDHGRATGGSRWQSLRSSKLRLSSSFLRPDSSV